MKNKPAIIPALPGFFVLLIDPNPQGSGALVTEPVIAWDIWPEDEGRAGHDVTPVTALYGATTPYGLRYPGGKTEILGSSRTFVAGVPDEEIAEHLREIAATRKLQIV